MSLTRQNYHKETEAAVNKQINNDLTDSYTYLAMMTHFCRDDVALKGFCSFFAKLSEEKREEATTLMDLQNKRGGRLLMADIKRPEKIEWSDGLAAMKDALGLEKATNQCYFDLLAIVHKHGDSQLEDLIEDEYLKNQVEIIKKMSDYVSQLTMATKGGGLGEYMFDKETLQES